jgi:phosphoserine phosphatase
MKTICRVIIEEHLAAKIQVAPSKVSRFSIQNQTFHRINQPQKIAIETAMGAIQSGLTAAVIPAKSLKPQAIFFDMDGTVIKEESLVEIAKVAGKAEDVAKLTELAMSGAMDFKTSLSERLKLLEGLTREQVQAIKPTLCEGIMELVSWCHLNNIKIFLISGGFGELAQPIAQKIGCTDYLANEFLWQDNIMQGRTRGPIIDAEAKKNALLNWIKSHQLQPDKTIVVGDGANDLLMMKIGGMAVGFTPKPILWPDIDAANHTGDHQFLIQALEL